MADLNLRVLVDVQGDQKLSGLGAGMQRFGANMTKFVTLPLVGIGAASLAMAADAEKSAAKLTAAFKNMGSTSGKTLAQLEQQAIDLGQATTFDDEAIMEAQAALLSFGAVGGEAFDRAIQGAADYAAATGTDVVAATKLLGKALADPEAGLARLTRVGIVFTDQQKEQVAALQASGDTLGAQNIILEAFEQRYAGVNAELQSTAAGQAAQALEDLQNAGEDIGAVFLPILASLAQGLSAVARWFTDLPAPIQGFIVAAAGIVAAIGPVVFIAGKLVTAFGFVTTAFNVMKLALLTNPFTALAVAVAVIAALIIMNWDKIVGFLKGVWETITRGFTALGKTLEDIWNSITNTVGDLVDGIIGAWRTLSLMTEVIWGSITGLIKGAINAVIGAINGFLGFLNGLSIGFPSFDIGPVHVEGWTLDPFNIPLIPQLAEGGIITGPTLAMLGERGRPEAVIPLDRAGSLNRTVNIYVQGEVRDEEQLLSLFERSERLNAALAGG